MRELVSLLKDPIKIGSVEVQPSGRVAFCEEFRHPVGMVGGVPLAKISTSSVRGLPGVRKDVVYIASKEVALKAKRFDVVYPSDPVLDEAGNLIGYAELCVAG